MLGYMFWGERCQGSGTICTFPPDTCQAGVGTGATALNTSTPMPTGIRAYCEQKAYEGLPLTLYHNNRDGTFTDVSTSSGLDKFVGRALGIVAIDVNDDGWPDLFIARDASPNLLLINQRDSTFKDEAVDAEVAYDEDGAAKAGTGVDAGDASGDGLPDFVVTNFNDQYHSLFVASKSFPYEDRTIRSRLAAMTKSFVGWGVKFIDYDNDGNLDIVLVNVHINDVIETTRENVKYKEPTLVAAQRLKRQLREHPGAMNSPVRFVFQDGHVYVIGPA